MLNYQFFKQPLVQLIIASMLLGFGAVFVVFIDFEPTIIAFYRLLLGGCLFGFVLLVRHEPLRISFEALFFSSMAGILFGIDLSFWNQSIVLVGPGIATILNSLQVFFMAILGLVIFRDKPSWKLWLSLFLTFIGVVLLSYHETQQSEKGLLGITTGVLSAIAFACSMIFLREAAKRQKYSLMNTMFYASMSGALAIGIYGYLNGSSFMTDDVASWVMIIIYAAFVHVIAWFLMAKSMPFVSVALVGLIMSLEPVTVFGIDLVLLGKSITLWQAIGAALTLFAIYLGSKAAKNK